MRRPFRQKPRRQGQAATGPRAQTIENARLSEPSGRDHRGHYSERKARREANRLKKDRLKLGRQQEEVRAQERAGVMAFGADFRPAAGFFGN